MKLPMRQLTVLVAAVLWTGAAGGDERPTVWVSEPYDHRDEENSMTVYPLDLERQTRRTSFNRSQAQTDEMIPPPGLELPEAELSDSAPFVEPPSARAGEPATRSMQMQSAVPGPTENRAGRRMAPEELPPPPAGLMYEVDGAMTSVLSPDGIEVSPWGGEAPAAVWSSGEWFQSGIWYTSADFLIVRRNRPRDRLLIGFDVTNPDNLFFNYGGTGGVEPAMRVTVGRFIGRDWENRDHSVEVGFLGIHEFRTGQGISSQEDGGLILLLDQKQGGINGADQWVTEHSSRFHSIETDLRLRHRPEKDRLVMAPDGTWTRQYTSSYVPSLLLGVRYLNLNEDYVFRSRSLARILNQQGALVPISRSEFGGDYDIETHNDLFGIQVGGEFINQRESWHWGVRGKAGAYINFAEQFTVAQFNDIRAPGPDAPGDPSIDIAPRAEQASRANEAFFGELSLMSAYHFTPNFTARASYDLMWLAGVALAPDQITFTESARLSLDGVIFYQGLSLGLEFVW